MRQILTIIFLLNSIISFGQKLTLIKVSVPNKTDEVFIVGNQESLGNWQPNKIKMHKKSDYQREISLNLTYPAEFKFTRGSWENEANVLDFKNGYNIVLNKYNSKFNFQITSWKDEKIESDRLSLKYDIKYLKSKYYPNEDRVLKIFIPDDYDASKKYPVVYTLDGQSLFDLLMKNMSILQDKTDGNNNIIPQCITVAIDNINRTRDLTPNTGLNTNIPIGTYTKQTKTFYKIINEEIVPLINSNYSTSGYNIIIGHSDAGHFVTQLYLNQDNYFDAVIALSVNDFSNYFQSVLPNKLKENTSKTLFLGYGNKDDEFNVLGNYMNKQNLKNKKFMVKEYNADHMQLPYTSLFDALKFVFSDYQFYDDLIEKMYNNDFDYKVFEKQYVDNIYNKFGIKSDINYDIYYLLTKSQEKNNLYVFNKILDEVDESNILQLQIRFYYSNEFNQNERAKNYLYKMLLSEDENDKLIFYANLYNQYIDFFVNKLKEPLGFIDFVEKAKEKWPEYTLEFNYLILKILVDEKIESPKKRKYYKYCEQNFKENRYFKIDDLKKPNKK